MCNIRITSNKEHEIVEHVSKGNSIVGKVIVQRNGGKENGEKEVHEDIVTLYNPTPICRQSPVRTCNLQYMSSHEAMKQQRRKHRTKQTLPSLM